MLQHHLDSVFELWRSERAPVGVPVELSRRCKCVKMTPLCFIAGPNKLTFLLTALASIAMGVSGGKKRRMSLLPGGSLLLGQRVQVLHHYHNCFLAVSQDSLVVAACFLDYQLDTRTRRTFTQHKSVGVDRSHVKRLHLKYVAC